jgi:hypothetical protein
VSVAAGGQQMRGAAPILHAVDDSLFHSCNEVESKAREFSRDIKDRVYTMGVFPRNGRFLYAGFLSEGYARHAVTWLAGYEPRSSPYALFYFVDGAYTFRCRDDQSHLLESTGPEGDPLQLKLAEGRAAIWHFFFTPINVAHVFVVADVPLTSLSGDQLLAEVTQRLGARVVFLYVRNNPWFLGYSPNSAPYIFTDSFKTITEEQYRASRTLVCYTGQKCGVVPSKE